MVSLVWGSFRATASMSSTLVKTPSWGTTCLGWMTDTTTSPTVSPLRRSLSHSTSQ